MGFLEVIKGLVRSTPVVTPDNFSVRDLLFQVALEEELHHFEHRERVPTSVSVSDLVYCSAKYWHGLRYPLIKVSQNYSPALALGRVIHKGVEAIVAERFHDFVRCEVPVEKSINLDDSDLPVIVRVAGRVDMLVGDDLVVEIKSGRSDYEVPAEHHVMQLRIYMHLTGCSRGLLVYVNPERFTEVYVEEPITEEELRSLVTDVLKNRVHPRWVWECRYCPYATICPWKKFNDLRRR